MFPALPKERALPYLRKNPFGLIALLCIALVAQAGPTAPPLHFQTSEGLRLELPANGNLRIENQRGVGELDSSGDLSGKNRKDVAPHEGVQRRRVRERKMSRNIHRYGPRLPLI